MSRLQEIDKRMNAINSMLENEHRRKGVTVEELKEQARELETEKRNLKGDNKMTKNYDARDYVPENTAVSQTEGQTEYRNFLETREAVQGLKTTDGFVPVPQEEIDQIKKLKDEQFQLKELVSVREVSRGDGTLPVVRAVAEPMVKVAELEKNPYLAVTPFTEVAFSVDTFRTQVPFSVELLEDSSIDVQQEIREYFTKLSVSTENNEILDLILNGDGVQTFETETANNADDIKSIINLSIAPNYEPTVVMNQTSFDTVSKWKDENGRYLTHELQDSQAKTFLGFDIIVVPNKLLEGSKVIVGDFEEAITLFDRSRYEVSFEMFENFGQALMLAIRFDVSIVDVDALVMIDLEEGV